MKRIAWLIDHAGARLLGGLAVVLLGVAATLHVVVLPAQQARLDRLLDQGSAARPVAAAGAADDAGRQLRDFYRHFGGNDTLPDHLARLYQIARTSGITLRQAEYRLVRERDSHLKRYQIVLPIQGSYPSVRLFVSATLEALPNAALDQVSFERRRIDDRHVDAQVRLTLYLPDT
jgi:hypothetical protein